MNRENERVYKAIIVGGGASGLVAAILLSERFGGENVLVAERLSRVGKKLLATGNGQCNVTGRFENISVFHGKSPSFCEYALDKYGKNALLSFYENSGVPVIFDGDKGFPLSRQASSVVDAFRFKLSALKTKTACDAFVTDISRKNGVFTVLTDSGEKFLSENVILACGGKAASHFGTDGNAYKLAEKFGHKITALYPSIVQLKCNVASLKGLKGLKQKVKVSAFADGVFLKSAAGDILFTDYGVSGNAAFLLSSYLTGKNGGVLSVDFIPDADEKILYEALLKKIKNCGYLTNEYLLSGFMNGKIAAALLRNVGVDLSAAVVKCDLEKIVKTVKNYRIAVTGTLGFDDAQVTRGGVETKGVNPETMESAFEKGLYIVGEMLDIDGDCGGYNLTWAFASGALAAESVK